MNLQALRAGMRTIAASGLFVAAIVNVPAALAQSNPLPKQVRQPTAAKVVAEHMAAFSACDWKRLMAQFPDNVEFFAPNGVTVRGRTAVGEMFAKVVKPPAEGGTCGLKVTVEHTFVVGDVINVQWRADAPFLAEPYRGADAYETKDGFMAAQVTTFDAAALKMKH
jgi:SnoaL-like domain